MSVEVHHGRALIEEARSTLDSVHRAALAADAGGLRRGLELAANLLEQTRPTGLGADADAAVAAVRADIAIALADLETGALTTMEPLIETARAKLAAL